MAEKALFPGHLGLLFEEHGVGFVGGPDEAHAFGGLHGVGAENDALDDEVRVGVDQDAILERAGLHLVGVDDDIARTDVILRNALPFLAGGKARAAAAAQIRVEDQLQHLGRGALADGGGERLVAAAGPVFVDGRRAAEVAVFKQDLRRVYLHRTGSSVAWRSSASTASMRSGVSLL